MQQDLAREISRRAMSPNHSFLKRALWFAAMGPIELYGRLSGAYRPPASMPPYAFTNVPPPREGPVVAFGDSLTEGAGAPAGRGYVEHLAEFLGTPVVNRGLGGDTSVEAVARLDADVMALAPRMVIVEFGGNDMMRGMPIEDCFRNLELVVRRVQSTGATAVLVGIRGSWLYKLDYDSRYRDLAMRTGCPLVPLALDGIWGKPWLMADAAHPNSRGYRVLARRVGRVVAPLLQSCG